MNTYECKKCGMSVNAQCGKCNLPLENAHLTLENGVVVQISQCPSCMGKIKSPQCCGAEMNCDLNQYEPSSSQDSQSQPPSIK